MARHTIPDEQIVRFEAGFRGNLVRPEDADYEDARTVWNGIADE